MDSIGSALSGIGSTVGSAASSIGSGIEGIGSSLGGALGLGAPSAVADLGPSVAASTPLLSGALDTTLPNLNIGAGIADAGGALGQAVSQTAPAALSAAAPSLLNGASGASISPLSASSAASALPSDAGGFDPTQFSSKATLGGDLSSSLTPTVQAATKAAPAAAGGISGLLKTAAPLLQGGVLLNALGQAGRSGKEASATQAQIQQLEQQQAGQQAATAGQVQQQNQTALQQQQNALQTQGNIQAAVTPGLLTELQGKLPAGAQATVDAATNAEIASIKSQYASRGLTGSSAEAQDIASAQMRGVQNSFAIAQQLAQSGLSALTTTPSAGSVTQLGEGTASLLEQLLNSETAQGTQLGQAITAFAGAAAK